MNKENEENDKFDNKDIAELVKKAENRVVLHGQFDDEAKLRKGRPRKQITHEKPNWVSKADTVEESTKQAEEEIEKLEKYKKLREEIRKHMEVFKGSNISTDVDALNKLQTEEIKLNILIDKIELKDKVDGNDLSIEAVTAKNVKLRKKTRKLIDMIVLQEMSPIDAWAAAGYAQYNRWKFQKVWEQPNVQLYLQKLKAKEETYENIDKETLINELRNRLPTASNNDAVNIVKTLSKLLGYDTAEEQDRTFSISWEGVDGSRLQLNHGKNESTIDTTTNATVIEDVDFDILESPEIKNKLEEIKKSEDDFLSDEDIFK